MFNDASQFIQGSSATVLSIAATDEIDLTATAVDLNGTLNVSGVATFQATPVFPDGSLAVADLDIDGATDIGAAIVDADLFIIDDGAGGTNRKVTASRLKTYAAFDADAAQVFNESGASVDFRIESDNNANMFVVDGSTDCIAINQAAGSGSYELDIAGDVRLYNSGDAFETIDFDSNRGSAGDFIGDITGKWNGTDTSRISLRAGSDTSNKDDGSFHVETSESGSLVERFRIANNGTHGISNNNNIGTTYTLDVQASGTPARINRTPDDGAIILFQAEGNTEGYISISGSTATYQTFTGGHWSQLTDNSQPTILKGTVMESIDEMCEWYQLEFESNDSAQTDKIKVQHALQSGQSVGDTVKHTHDDGVEYDAKIIKETNYHLAKSKVSDTSASTSVYGVFQTWDEDNDMTVISLGTYVVRIHKDQTVAKGDLLESNGDGTAKKQSSTAMLSSTIAKVTANVKIETYSDGSYTVPCTLHCG
tara:strand:- start:649 stop:2091 length:1443 start_codon:yes stop_codon:yes gene_type:complete